MAVNKNFVVKNGLEVNTSLIFADAETDKVGIANTQPTYTLHVNGGIGATHSYVSGVGTFNSGLFVAGPFGFNVGAAGSVGIGTNTQNYPLEIFGTSGETVAQITGNVNIDGNLIVDDLTADQSVTSISTVTSILHVKDGIGGGIADIDSIYVSGITSVSDLTVTGVSTFLNVDDNNLGITTSGSVRISGGVGISKNLTVGSAATIGSSLFVGGKSTFYDYSTVNNTLNVSRVRPSTISFASSLSVSAQETEPREVVFSNDGKTMYVLGNAGDDITWYNLSTPWRISSSSFVSQYSVSSRLTNPTGMYFKPDGTKFYIVGTVGAGATSVNQYSCSIPWDLTTASYDSVSFSVLSQEPSPMAIEFKPDGTKFYIVGLSNDSIFQYSCSTPWNVSTASYDSVVYSISVHEPSPEGIRFSSDGLKLLALGTTKDSIAEYNLTTPWDISTVSFGSSIAYLTSVGEATPSGLYWKPDGSKLYVSGYGNDRIYEYNITSDADLEVIGETKLYGDVDIYQDVDVYGTLNGYNDAYFNNDLTVLGSTTTRNIFASGIITATAFNGQINAGLSTLGVATATNLTAQQLNVTGLSTFAGITTVTGTTLFAKQLNVSGIATANTFVGQINAGVGTITTLTNTNINSTGIGTFSTVGVTNLTSQQLNVTGVSTFAGITTVTGTTLFAKQLNVSGIASANTFVGQINAGVGTVTTLTSTDSNLTNINSTGISTFSTVGITNLTAQQLNVTGLSTFAGITTVTGETLFAKQLNVSGVGTFGSLTVGTISLSSGNVTATTFTGSLSGNATSATNATNATNISISTITSTDTTTSVVLVGNQSTGNQSPFIDSGLSYNANTNNLAATTFTGSLSGNATSATTATYATSAGIATALNSTSSVNTTGIITATAFYGDGTNITGVLASPGGSNGQIQYKNGTILGGAANMYYNNSTGFVGIGSTQPTVALDIYTGNIRGVFKDYGEVYYNLGNTGTATTINLANGNFFTATLTGNCTFTFTTGLAAAAANSAVSFTLFLINDGTAGRSIIWPNTVWWPGTGQTAPSRTTTANRIDVYTFITYNNGAKWYGTISMFDYQ